MHAANFNLWILVLVPRVAGECGNHDSVQIDFSSVTNPAVAMEWTDALGLKYTGTRIPDGATDTTGGAFPGGNIRWKNLGYDGDVPFDLLVTVSENPTYYSDLIDVEYRVPSTQPQAVFTSSGFACLGFGMRPSYCISGASLNTETAECSDGTPATLRAAEFDFRFVHSNTNEPMPPFSAMHTTFYDVDGDTLASGAKLYELVSVVGATTPWQDPGSFLEQGVFYESPSEPVYAIATQPINTPTNFNGNPAQPSAEELRSVAYFLLEGTSEFKLLLSGLSSITPQNNRGCAPPPLSRTLSRLDGKQVRFAVI